LTNFPSVLHKFTCFLHTLRVFRSPYFYHDAFMHHPMQVLDAPGCGSASSNGLCERTGQRSALSEDVSLTKSRATTPT